MLPILNINRELAVRTFLNACDAPDDRMLAASEIQEFFRYASRTHCTSLQPLFRRMSLSAIPTVSMAGSAWITVAALHAECPWDMALQLSKGTVAQRKGVANATVSNFEDSLLGSRCAELLDQLLGDPDDTVLEEATKCFQNHQVLRNPEGKSVARRYAQSRAFDKNPAWLIRAIRDTPDSLIPLAEVFESICNRMVTLGLTPTQRNNHPDHFELQQFIPLILRMYEQAEQGQHRELRNMCLNWWDQLLEARMAGVAQLLGDLDAIASTTF